MSIVELKETQVIEKKDFPYNWNSIENQWIPMSDGVNLASRIFMPETEEPIPAILEYIPYRKRDALRGNDEPMHGFFAGNGYVAVRVDIRGTGDSEGMLCDEYLKQEQDDALEVIEWISKQPWCNGNVGMMGYSWGGFNSLQVAARQPKALKAIICVGFTDDRYNCDIHYKGGLPYNEGFCWANTMMAYQTRAVDCEFKPDTWIDETIKRVEEMPMLFKNWYSHQTRDEYWKHGSVCEDYSAIKVPVFAVDGWADSYTNTVLSLIEGLNVPRKAIIGPWGHMFSHYGCPGPSMDFLGQCVEWWDKWLKNIDNDALKCPFVQFWMEDSMKPDTVHPVSNGRWVKVDSWPSPDVKDKPLSLTYGKLMEQNNENKEIVTLSTVPNHGISANEWFSVGVLGESPADQRFDDGMAMVFESDALSNDLEIFGYPKFEVNLESSKPVAMLWAQLSDVHPDGAVTRVSWGQINLTHLEGHDKVICLEPGKIVTAKIKLDVCGHSFPRDHRIRLSIANSNWPLFWPSPEQPELKLDLSTAKFTLPIFNGSDCKGPCMDAKNAPEANISILMSGEVDRKAVYDMVTDTWTYTTKSEGGVFGEGVFKCNDIGNIGAHSLTRAFSLSNKNPLSARYTVSQRLKNGRPGCETDVEMVMTLTCDKDNLYMKGYMDFKINDRPYVHKDYDETIKRNGI